MPPKALQMLAKVSLHKATRMKEICVNGCQNIYLCVNQFGELLKLVVVTFYKMSPVIVRLLLVILLHIQNRI
jgi:hypothetical protein